MPSTPPSAHASSRDTICAALARHGLVPDAARVTSHWDRDCVTFVYPGYRPVDITGYDLISATSVDDLLDHKVAEMLRMPVI